MLKAEIKEHDDRCDIHIEIMGDVRKICADISALISAVDDRLTENDPEIGHAFKILLTRGFMDGICFDTDREHMKHYIAEGDKLMYKNKKDDMFAKMLSDLLDFIKDKNATIEKVEDDDETK